ncbi:hypothetical protein GTN30_00300 [Macrococcoides canis]|uniref:Uncharacterized protein n=1 Tax=Macrococcoides canis TaxID=1855823 RepID=A0A4Y1NMR9_9STAP|nr:hypothetical protein [Macrococcus canis]AXE74985.1 hypothetical protein [Macrococcus canis]QIH77107.1 hypothetical protein GTN30_00300 [Macrococcus canis]
MTEHIINALIFAAILASQYFLSRTKYKFLGLVVPILCTLYAAYLYINEVWPLWALALLLIIAYVLLFSQYDKGQKDYKKRRETELSKMRSQDL